MTTAGMVASARAAQWLLQVQAALIIFCYHTCLSSDWDAANQTVFHKGCDTPGVVQAALQVLHLLKMPRHPPQMITPAAAAIISVATQPPRFSDTLATQEFSDTLATQELHTPLTADGAAAMVPP